MAGVEDIVKLSSEDSDKEVLAVVVVVGGTEGAASFVEVEGLGEG
jgi:hypothetical protein